VVRVFACGWASVSRPCKTVHIYLPRVLMMRVCECVAEILSAGVANCSYAKGFIGPRGVALDASSGVLYVSNSGTNSVCIVPAGGGACSCEFSAWQSFPLFVLFTCSGCVI
jgi:hypothetical protein